MNEFAPDAPPASAPTQAASSASATDAQTFAPEAFAPEASAPDIAARLISPEAVLEAIRPVVDPEVGISIVDLGLVYRIKVDKEVPGRVVIEMTLTSPMCPVGPQILQATKFSASMLPGVQDVDIRLVWDPPWDPRIHASEEVKMRLGIWD